MVEATEVGPPDYYDTTMQKGPVEAAKTNQKFKNPKFKSFGKRKSEPPKKGRKVGAAWKLSKSVEKQFWHFLPCARNVEKSRKIFPRVCKRWFPNGGSSLVRRADSGTPF